MLVAVARIMRFSARRAAALERRATATVWLAVTGAGMGAAHIVEVSKQRAVTARMVNGFRSNFFITSDLMNICPPPYKNPIFCKSMIYKDKNPGSIPTPGRLSQDLENVRGLDNKERVGMPWAN